MFKRVILVIIMISISVAAEAQMKVAITIDDVPNTLKFHPRNFEHGFLNMLDSLQIPVAIFVNEGDVYRNEFKDKNLELLKEWCARDYVTIGNHTRDHSRYSSAGFQKFTQDVEAGEKQISRFAKKYRKKIKYFRFPYNDLGVGEEMRDLISEYLQSKKYTIAPYTVESSDWMFNYIYAHYLFDGNEEKAREIGNTYVEKTIEYFKFFDNLSEAYYNRKINHIYICHDNYINADYFDLLVEKLKALGYEFISLDEAMKDKVYSQKSHYFGKYGFSWLYRWMENNVERKDLMKKEPDIKEYYQLYETLMKEESENE